MTPLALMMMLAVHVNDMAISDMVIEKAERPEIDAAKAWIHANDMAPEAAQPGLSDRGRAYLDMILATPLPVQQWIDPRSALLSINNPGRHEATPSSVMKKLAPQEQPFLPSGFVTWTGADPKGPNLNLPPQAMKPDVIVIWRDGKTRKGRPHQGAISSFNWAHTGGNDDICGWLVVREAEEHVT